MQVDYDKFEFNLSTYKAMTWPGIQGSYMASVHSLAGIQSLFLSNRRIGEHRKINDFYISSGEKIRGSEIPAKS